MKTDWKKKMQKKNAKKNAKKKCKKKKPHFNQFFFEPFLPTPPCSLLYQNGC
jgi:hypothetical protein